MKCRTDKEINAFIKCVYMVLSLYDTLMTGVRHGLNGVWLNCYQHAYTYYMKIKTEI